MGDSNEEVSLTDVVVSQPTIADQNELILQLMQQIAEMRVKFKRDWICLHQDSMLMLLGDLQSTYLLQIWIHPRTIHLQLLKIRRS